MIIVISGRFIYVVGIPLRAQAFSYLCVPPLGFIILDGRAVSHGHDLFHNFRVFIGEKFPLGINISGGLYVAPVDLIE